jgi:3-hydroxyacyl-[acyl-carrier-protein] dehydratase
LKKNNQLNIEQILKMIPHRHPFVLIDRVLEYSDMVDGSRLGRKVKALKNVTFNEAFFAGHFPGRAVMPGVLIIESMAQGGMIACWRPSDPPMDVAIARVGEFRIHKPVVPGDQLIIEGEVIKDRGQMLVLNLKSSVDGELVTEFELLASVTPSKFK